MDPERAGGNRSDASECRQSRIEKREGRLKHISSSKTCIRGKTSLTGITGTHSNSLKQVIEASERGTTASAIDLGIDRPDLGRIGPAGVNDAAWLVAFFLKHHRSPSDRELEDHAWSVEFQEQNGRPPVLDDWIDRYSELRHPG